MSNFTTLKFLKFFVFQNKFDLDYTNSLQVPLETECNIIYKLGTYK